MVKKLQGEKDESESNEKGKINDSHICIECECGIFFGSLAMAMLLLLLPLS